MTDQQKSAETTSRLSWIATILITLIFGAIGGYAIRENKGVEISLGNLKLTVAPDETFAQVLNKATEKDPKEVEAILASRQYYNLTDANLVDQLEHLDASKPETQEISLRLRRLLWDLRGPFKIPDTLSGADERMSKALDALETARRENKQANALLAQLWKQSLEGEGIFYARSFNATVEIVQGAPNGKILVCPSDDIASMQGMTMTIMVHRGQGWRLIDGEIKKPDPSSLFDCGGSALTVEKLLAEEGTPRLGISESAFRKLVPASGPDVGEGRTDAKIQLFVKFNNTEETERSTGGTE